MAVNRQGTNGPDKAYVGPDEYYVAGNGDDDITLGGGGSAVSPGQGNDVVRVQGNQGRFDHAVYYWESPAPVLVDLRNGYALDGFGTRDTLIGVRSVHGLKRDGDRAFGSDADEQFFLMVDGAVRSGRIVVDAGGGTDMVSFFVPRTANSVLPTFKASADGRRLTAQHPTAPGFVAELTGFEEVGVYDETTRKGSSFKVSSFITLDQAGPEILLRGAMGWHSAATVGRSIELTYSFLQARPERGGEGGSGFFALSVDQQAVVREVLGRLASQTGLQFREVQADQGQIRFGINQQTATRGYSFIPGLATPSAEDGDVWLDLETAALLRPGQEGYYVLLHELGHALGLQHPLPESDRSGATVLLPSLARVQNTVMLDADGSQAMRPWPTWFGMMDMQALRTLYGDKPVAAQDDVYDAARLTALSGGLLLDDGGVDTIDLSALTTGVQVDLRKGQSWSFGADGEGQLRGNLTLAWSSMIEHVRGTASDDVLVGNDLDNTIASMGGNDIIDGGPGSDLVLFLQEASAYRLGHNGSSFMVAAKSGQDGVALLSSIEQLGFADRRVPLATKGHGTYTDLPDSLYQFFIVAFGAAPGVTYMDQIAQAYRAGASVRQIVDAFVSKSQFTDTYPLTLSHQALAEKLVANVVGTSASAESRADAVRAVAQTLDNGASRGQVIFAVFGNLASRPLQGDEWSRTALQFQKQVAAAKSYTDLMSMASEDLLVLRAVLSKVTPDSDVSSPDAVVQLVGQGLFGG